MRAHHALLPILALLLTACSDSAPPRTDDTGPGLAITTEALPAASVAQAYRSSLTASGGTPAYSWRVAQGALPTGLSLSTLGEITGTPQSAGTSSFDAEVRDSRGRTVRATFELEVLNAALQVASSTLPDAYVGDNYAAQLDASGGTAPYTWTLAEGPLPSGVRLDAQGSISGVPASSGTFSVTVHVQDATGLSSQRALSLSAFTAPYLAGGTLPSASLGAAYSTELHAVGGRPPLTFRITSGALPTGLQLDASLVRGTPNAPGADSFTVEVQDANRRAASATFNLTVQGGITITPSALPDAYTDAAYRQGLLVMGGRAPYAWALSAGSLPAGIRLTSAGLLEGTASTTGTFSFSVQVTDADARVATRALDLVVYRPPSANGPALQLDGYVSQSFSATYTVTGGKAPYSFAPASPLPSWLQLSSSGQLSGTPPAPGTTSGQAVVTDANGRTGTRDFTLTVYELPTVVTTSLPDARKDVPYSTQLQASGGKAPLSWHIVSGMPPSGLTLSTSGTLSGTLSELGYSAFTVTVTDATGQQGWHAMVLHVRTASAPLTVAHWNLEWFGATTQGPPDSTSEGGTPDDLQIAHARDIIRDSGANVWGLVEMVDAADFATLKEQLPGFNGFLANDTSFVPNGTAYYSNSEQKPGILYDSTLTLQEAQLILTANAADFGGRPPLRVNFTTTVQGVSTQLVVIVVHLKAFDNETAYGQRQRSSAALKSYLDTSLPTERVLVIGDWNDDVDQSITRGSDGGYLPTPFAPFVADTQRYTFITEPLSRLGQRTTVDYRDAIDHTLASNEMATNYLPGSVEILRPDGWLPNYGNIVSDHYPVISRYDLGDSGGGTDPEPVPNLIINEVLPNEPIPPGQTVSDTHYEFIEVYNAGTSTADLSGWSLSDSASVRHVFAPGTTLAPGRVFVVFGGARGFPAGTPATVAASSGGLGLNNDGDIVRLLAPDGSNVNEMSYGGTFDNISFNRSPDATPDAAFDYHHLITPGLSSSPGLRVDGRAF
ncbi:putative Ig domain-containing protein [Myxococcus sp. NMCA1]|uniref:putative Ig domain-containing protein n=1 Tax=Myxococcus sp. NMCA1 TaxID=2996785 RepID=UPI002286A8DD|nr:putative Ig domain-containing protein [Myxococcus sp. NMCA1]WAM26249.1 putative Ig domain-containing protein [Myxococcus sp. NMCA1]